jgi:hypothetical protein
MNRGAFPHPAEEWRIEEKITAATQHRPRELNWPGVFSKDFILTLFLFGVVFPEGRRGRDSPDESGEC